MAKRDSNSKLSPRPGLTPVGQRHVVEPLRRDQTISCLGLEALGITPGRHRPRTGSVCKYAYTMNVGRLVTNAKGSSGRSVRRLASDARVAGSTITRIQAGVVDPTVDTLARIVGAAGFELQLTIVPLGGRRPTRLGDLADAWTRRDGRLRLDWTRWRAVLDELALHPERIPEAIYVAPPPAGERIVDALLAAVAEKLADDAGLSRPNWTEAIAPLKEPYWPPVARVVNERAVPTQLAARGLMIDTTSLWRDRRNVDA